MEGAPHAIVPSDGRDIKGRKAGDRAVDTSSSVAAYRRNGTAMPPLHPRVRSAPPPQTLL
jgi:hypothetical protein